MPLSLHSVLLRAIIRMQKSTVAPVPTQVPRCYTPLIGPGPDDVKIAASDGRRKTRAADDRGQAQLATPRRNETEAKGGPHGQSKIAWLGRGVVLCFDNSD